MVLLILVVGSIECKSEPKDLHSGYKVQETTFHSPRAGGEKCIELPIMFLADPLPYRRYEPQCAGPVSSHTGPVHSQTCSETRTTPRGQPVSQNKNKISDLSDFLLSLELIVLLKLCLV